MRDGPADRGDLFSRESRHREDLLTEFEEAWRAGPAPDLATFVRRTLPPWLPRREETIAELIRVDQELRIKQRERLPVEDYLARLDGFQPERGVLLELVLSEFNLRCRFEVPPALAEYQRRFPDLAKDLRQRLTGWSEAASRDGSFARPLTETEVVLHVAAGPHRGMAIRLEQDRPLIVGRGAGADVRLEQDRHLSRFHLRLSAERGRVTFADRSSRNGTFLDGRKVSDGALLPDSVLRCGESEIVVAAEADATCDLQAPARDGVGLSGYAIQTVVSNGSLGRMFRAIRTATGEEVALKRIDRPGARERMGAYLSEIMTLRELRSRVLLLPADLGLSDGRPWIATPWHSAGTFDEIPPRLEPAVLCRVAERVLTALGAAHRRGLVHGSVTPSKILLNPTDGGLRIKVTGFGLRRCFSKEEAPAPRDDVRAVADMLKSALSGAEPVEIVAVLERAAKGELEADSLARELSASRAAAGLERVSMRRR